MRIAFYRGTRPGLAGLGNFLIRRRLSGRYSHSEILFEPGDDVDHLMPDGTTAPIDGAYWCASSVAMERLPAWSPRRAGKLGGVRFKRIVPDPAEWDFSDLPGFDALFAATWAARNAGTLYDWQLIIGGLAWFVPQKTGRVTCSEASAEMLRFRDAWRFDPCVLESALAALGRTINLVQSPA